MLNNRIIHKKYSLEHCQHIKEGRKKHFGKRYGISQREIYCEECKKKFIGHLEKNKYCSHSCHISNRNKKRAGQYTLTEKHKQKIRLKMQGKNNHSWKGGISYEKYGLEFDEKLKEEIRRRDNYKCQMCWKTEKEVNRHLSVHHIDYNKKNNNLYNLILLCINCHSKTNFSREDWITYFKTLLEKPKIFISILNEGWIRTELMFALTKWFKESEYRIYLEAPSDRPIENNRNKIVKRFLETGYEYLIQIDSDNVPSKNPLELIEIMRQQNIHIMSCPVWIYQHKLILNIYKLDKTDGMLVPVDPTKEKGLIEIDSTGTGVLLTSRRVLEVIKAPFERKYDENGIEELGQDLYFSRKAKEADLKIFSHLDYISKHYKEIDLRILQKVDSVNSKDIGPGQRG